MHTNNVMYMYMCSMHTLQMYEGKGLDSLKHGLGT